MSEVQLIDAADDLIEFANQTIQTVRESDPTATYSTVFQTIRALAKSGALDIQPAPNGWTSIDTSHD